MKRFFKEFSLLLIHFPYRWLVQILPFQFGYQVATLLGSIRYLFLASKQREQFMANLDLIFGSKFNSREKRTTIRRFYINRQKELVDLFILGRKDYKKYFQACTDENRGSYDKVLSQGKGVVGVNFHFGSSNLLAPYAIYAGYKIIPFLVLPGTRGVSPWVSQKILNIKSSIWKERGNFQILTASDSLISTVKTQYRALNENHIISAAGDGPLGKNFVLVDFFSVKLKVSLGPALTSAKSGADMILNFVIRRKDNAQHFVFIGPIKVENNDEETLKRVVQEYIKHLEYHVSQYPDHWMYWPRMEVEGTENGVPVVRLRLLQSD
jgi:lauroyl/myristoyl acyltransferase